ncbi:amidase [Alkalicaulis satelles]|uniref:Amidase n=1 Tax=Alkalicaulis satelles TaxID=2609175 RepID=A0A5M6ZL27_9PROT|nr:amidase [Alkalicaulis satelles]KAA5804665.1 amidase [Alkalicaulis satelles]
MTTSPDQPRATRRGVLALMAGAGGALAACSPPQARPEGLTANTLSCAETLAGVRYSPAQRQQMLSGIEAWQARAERLRALDKPNALHPGLVFNPVLPGRTMRVQDNAVTGLSADPGPLPSDPVDIAYAPAWKLGAWMARGALSSAELTELYLARIEAHGAALECFIHVSADRARAEAAARDAERAAGQVRGPLHGVPYALKDIIDVQGLPATWGATVYSERMGEETAIVARRLEEAGAVLLGKASTGAIAYGDIWFDGVTRNPFNPAEGSSGSSAGPAAAVAAGLCGFAIGTETLGSIVSPSHRCGNTGLRPTFGRVARTGAMALCWSLDKIGPMVRSSPDAALVLAAINGADVTDPASRDHGFEADFARDLSGLRLGYNADWFENGADPDRAALEAARSLGVELVAFEVDERPWDALLMQLEAEAAAAFEHLTLEGLDERLRWQDDVAWPNTWRRTRFLSAVDLVNADRLRRQAMEMMDARMEGLDAVIGPNFAGSMLLITNYTGHPQLAFRSGFIEAPTRTIFGEPADESGDVHRVPYATSLWAPLYEEGVMLALGAAIEARLGVADERPPAFS